MARARKASKKPAAIARSNARARRELDQERLRGASRRATRLSARKRSSGSSGSTSRRSCVMTFGTLSAKANPSGVSEAHRA